MTDSRVILDSTAFGITIERLCHQLIENHRDFTEVCLIGVQPRGIRLAARIQQRLREMAPDGRWHYGSIDPTFHRDDFRRADKPLTPSETSLNFPIEQRDVVLIDDVFYTGRTIRAAMDALLHFGRPSKVELLVLIDRRWSRHLPIQPDYVGRTVDSVESEKVLVEWGEAEGHDRIWIIPDTNTASKP